MLAKEWEKLKRNQKVRVINLSEEEENERGFKNGKELIVVTTYTRLSNARMVVTVDQKFGDEENIYIEYLEVVKEKCPTCGGLVNAK